MKNRLKFNETDTHFPLSAFSSTSPSPHVDRIRCRIDEAPSLSIWNYVNKLGTVGGSIARRLAVISSKAPKSLHCAFELFELLLSDAVQPVQFLKFQTSSPWITHVWGFTPTVFVYSVEVWFCVGVNFHQVFSITFKTIMWGWVHSVWEVNTIALCSAIHHLMKNHVPFFFFSPKKVRQRWCGVKTETLSRLKISPLDTSDIHRLYCCVLARVSL